MNPLSLFVTSHRTLLSPTNLIVLLAITISLFIMRGEAAFAQVPPGVVFSMLDEIEFNGENHVEVEHQEAFELVEGAFALRFKATHDVARRQGLFSKDFTGNRGGGDITAYIEHGRVKVRIQSSTRDEYVDSYEGSIQPGEEYHLAVTFGPDGFWLYLNGEVMEVEGEFRQGLENNTQNMAIGANVWSRTEERPDATWDHFVGIISDFMLFDSQLGMDEIAELSGYGPEPDPMEPYVMDGWLYGTNADERLEADAYGVSNVHGGYGDDEVIGGSEGGMFYGGHGEDTVIGSDEADIIYSYSDGREPVIAQEYGPDDDPQDEIDPDTRTYYPYQPIEADDVLTGGGGADKFHFRVLINAKRYIILRHVRNDGTIDWSMNGVAGENDFVHDHWVDMLGNEVITDFNRDEGDHIEVVGHTVEVYRVTHEDSDDDGILDNSVLYVRSNQGRNGGAHDKDKLGTIRVFGDLVMRSDYRVEQVEYGIVETIAELDEAITPPVYTSVSEDGSPPPYPVVDDGELPDGAVFGVLDEVEFDGESHIEVGHKESFELSEGTFALRFKATHDVARRQGLFSKDFIENRGGGDITGYIEGGRFKVRLQSASTSVTLQTFEGSVLPGEEYHGAVTFGPGGLQLYLNGRIMAVKPEFQEGLENNTQNMAIGANTWSRTEEKPYATWDHFVGNISDLMLFDSQHSADEVALLAGVSPEPDPDSEQDDNAAPVASDGSVTTTEGVSVDITLIATDDDGDSLDYTIVDGPSNGTLSGDAPDLTYMPDDDFSGNDSFKFIANDGTKDSNEATISIEVVELEETTVLIDAPGSVVAESEIELMLLADSVENLAGSQFKLSYDPNVLTFMSATVADDFMNCSQLVAELSAPGTLALTFGCAEGGASGNSVELWTVRFGVGSVAEPTETELAVFDVVLRDQALAQIPSNGSTSSTIVTTGMCGDLNDDSIVDLRDVILELQIIVGMIVPSDNQLFLADVYMDGVLDVADAILTLRHVAGMENIQGCGVI